MSIEGKFLIAVQNLLACSKEHGDQRPCSACVKVVEEKLEEYKRSPAND